MLKLSVSIFQGRINRKQLLVGCLLYAPIIFIVLFLMFIVITPFLNSLIGLYTGAFNNYMYNFFLAVQFPFSLLLHVKRLHDLNKGVLILILVSLLTLISNTALILTFAFYIYLFIAKGSENANDFGENPKGKSAFQAIFNSEKNFFIEFRKLKLRKKIIYFLFLFVYLTSTILITHYTLPYFTRSEFVSSCKNENLTESRCICIFNTLEKDLGINKILEVENYIKNSRLELYDEEERIKILNGMYKENLNYKEYINSINKSKLKCSN